MHALISTNVLEQLVTLDGSMMTDRASVIRDTMVDDGAGGQMATPVTVATKIPCRIMVRRFLPYETNVAEQLQNSINMEIRFPTGTQLQNTDRITIGTRTFEVTKAMPHTWQTSLLVRVVEIT